MSTTAVQAYVTVSVDRPPDTNISTHSQQYSGSHSNIHFFFLFSVRLMDSQSQFRQNRLHAPTQVSISDLQGFLINFFYVNTDYVDYSDVQVVVTTLKCTRRVMRYRGLTK